MARFLSQSDLDQWLDEVLFLDPSLDEPAFGLAVAKAARALRLTPSESDARVVGALAYEQLVAARSSAS